MAGLNQGSLSLPLRPWTARRGSSEPQFLPQRLAFRALHGTVHQRASWVWTLSSLIWADILSTCKIYVTMPKKCYSHGKFGASKMALVVRNLPANAGDIKGSDLIPGSGSFLEESTAIHSSILAWRIPWTEEPDRLQSTGSQSVRHDWSDLAHTMHHVPGTKISPWHVQHAFLFFTKWKK